MDIVLADDHALVREGLKPFLEELDAGARVIEAEHFEAARVAARTAPDLRLILLDLEMPGMNALGGVRTLVEEQRGVPVVILSGTHDQELILKAFELGIAGFIPKSTGSEVMMSALSLVLAGERYLPSQLLLPSSPAAGAPDRFADRGADTGAGRGAAQPAGTRPPPAAPSIDDTIQIANNEILERLSTRERMVLELLVGGMTNKEIARSIALQEATVKIHVKNIYRKMGVSNRAQAVRTAIQPDWVMAPSGAIN